MNKIHQDIHIYTPHSPYQGNVDLSCCRAAVSDGGRSVGFHQCNRKGVEKIDDFLFCSLHALEINRTRGEIGYDHVTYVAHLEYGKPHLAKVFMLNETEKSFDAVKSEDILGHTFFSGGLERKRNSHNRSWKYFSDYNEALLWLYQQSEDCWRRAQERLEESVNTMNELARMVRELNAEET